MEQAAFTDYVENRYRKQMEFYSGASAKNQKNYKQFQWILVVLSALTPVMVALVNIVPGLQIITVVVAAVVAILTTGLKTFNYQELWVNYRTTYEKLKPEIYYYNFNVGPYAEAGIDKESLFVTRVESFLDAEHMQWPPAKQLKQEQNKEQQPVTTGEAGDNEAEPQVAAATGVQAADAKTNNGTEAGDDTPAIQTETDEQPETAETPAAAAEQKENAVG